MYTTQPVIKSGCVLRRSNVGVLERENLVTQHEVDMCKSRMNTFAYMGDLKVRQPAVHVPARPTPCPRHQPSTTPRP